MECLPILKIIKTSAMNDKIKGLVNSFINVAKRKKSKEKSKINKAEKGQFLI